MSTHPTERSRVEVHGFDVTACTHADPAYQTGHLVWVGLGAEGRWLTVAEARELAGAIYGAAAILREEVPA
ncbi:hypothetical protein [Roseateles sp. LKC17W]|uniref:Uncharacterized protein n=1 Tax=Pelomonas margarita TaxID=3299031 RepID=A0ABW7FIG5_9BURK